MIDSANGAEIQTADLNGKKYIFLYTLIVMLFWKHELSHTRVCVRLACH